jgi:hypothetical protein
MKQEIKRGSLEDEVNLTKEQRDEVESNRILSRNQQYLEKLQYRKKESGREIFYAFAPQIVMFGASIASLLTGMKMENETFAAMGSFGLILSSAISIYYTPYQFICGNLSHGEMSNYRREAEDVRRMKRWIKSVGKTRDYQAELYWANHDRFTV